MHFDDDDRIAELQRALDSTLVPVPRPDATVEERHVQRLWALTARIDALTREMKRRPVASADSLDILTSRLLLHAMGEALTLCRAVTEPARDRILASLETVRQARSAVAHDAESHTSGDPENSGHAD
jgi:hypothetical protein